MSYSQAVKAINKHHILLVYPIKNAREPGSLWTCLHPRSTMRWDWSEDADPRVVKLWHLKNELCENADVVYAKWFRDRATFFSKQFFVALLRLLRTPEIEEGFFPPHVASIYDELLDNSPQTPQMLRQSVELTGSHNRAAFEKATKFLWRRLLIVGTGEVDEGQFPALAMGATRHIFEDLWDQATSIEMSEAHSFVYQSLPADSAFLKYLDRMVRKVSLGTSYA